LPLRREELEPELGVYEAGDLSLTDANLGKDFILSRTLTRLSTGLSGVNFSLESACGGVNRHAGAVEGEGEEDILAELALEADLELTFRHRVCMPYIILNIKSIISQVFIRRRRPEPCSKEKETVELGSHF
jgi:hypothetical protein